MSKVDPRDFLLNTDFEMDKIIYFKEGELNAGQYDVDIDHNLGFTPLVFGVCAFQSDFSDSRSIPYSHITQDNSVDFRVSANNTKLRLSYINYSGSPAKIYYRIYGFEPTGSHAKVGPTDKYAKEFILNTDYNYCKLFKVGTASAGSTIDHNLGYIPQVLAWRESGGWVSPIEESATSSAIIITDSSILFNYPSLGIDKVHYRIYYDEA